MGTDFQAFNFIEQGIIPSRNRAYGIVHFLSHCAYRWDARYVFMGLRAPSVYASTSFVRPEAVNKLRDLSRLAAPLPGHHVRHLEIDNSRNLCSQHDLESLLPLSLGRLRNLISCTYQGPLSPTILAAIIWVNGLKCLEIRSGNQVLNRSISQGSLQIPWIDRYLDFEVLVTLRNLRILRIGRLMNDEASGLARAVGSLPLEKLELDCWGWQYEEGFNWWIRDLDRLVSPLVSFLSALMRLEPTDRRLRRGFPCTMKGVRLYDAYHIRTLHFHRLVANAIVPCKNLEWLGLGIRTTRTCGKILDQLDLPASPRVISLHSWRQLSCEVVLHPLYLYKSPSGEPRSTAPLPEPGAPQVRNILRTLEEVVARHQVPRKYFRRSMWFLMEPEEPPNVMEIHDPYLERCMFPDQTQGPGGKLEEMMDVIDSIREEL